MEASIAYLENRGTRHRQLIRAVNERMLQLNETFADVTGTFVVICECTRLDCIQQIEIWPEAYNHIRETPDRFVVLADHVTHEHEHVRWA